MATITFDQLHHHLESIPHQIGVAILRSEDGSSFQPPSGTLSDHDVQILYKMLLEVGGILEPNPRTVSNVGNSEKGLESFKRFTVERRGDEGEKMSYSVCVTVDGFVCIVKRRIPHH